jgi:hypothetical protein
MALALPRIQGFPCRAGIAASLYQSDAVGIGCAATGSRHGMSQSRRDDFGRLWLQPRATTRTTGTAKCWRVKSMQQVSIPGSFKRPAINSNMTLASVAPIAKCDGAGDRLQQRASIGIHHRAAQMGTALRRGRSISALAAFGCDDGLGKLARAHLERGGAGRRLTLRPARKHRHRRRRPSGFPACKGPARTGSNGAPRLTRSGAPSWNRRKPRGSHQQPQHLLAS